jgi:ABC-type transporter Mla subunit MlaD
MAEPLLNELIEEATSLCGELSDLSDEGASTIEDLTERVGALSETLSEGGQEVVRRCRDLASQLDTFESDLGAAGGEAKTALDTVVTTSQGVGTRLDEVVEKIRQALADLEAFRTELAGKLADQVEAAQDDYTALTDKVTELRDALTDHATEATDLLDQFGETVAGVRRDLRETMQRVLDAMGELQAVAGDQTQDVGDSLDLLLNAQSTALVDLANRMLTAHNAAVVALRKKLTEEAFTRLAEGVEPLTTAIEALGQLCGDEETALAERSSEILEKVQEALAIMGRINPILELSERL